LGQAYYSPSADVVVLPPPGSFIDAEAYAAAKAHELTHWTKHPTRLDRNLGGTRFGDEGYARENWWRSSARRFSAASWA
jgi:antirestriction protein ArdC